MTQTQPAETQPGTANFGAVDERDLESRLSALTLEQKVRLLTGADFWSLHPEPAAGLRRMVLSDGPAGVRGELWDERDTSANIPSPTALAATWDEARTARIGSILAAEARRKGVDVLLAPTVNLHRTPFGGRHFECFSEDPLLTGRIGAAFVRGVQSGGVAATVKHFVANDTETERMSVNALVAPRPLRELYLAPFETIVTEAGVWSVMAAYNRVNGHSMTESPMIREILHQEWDFDGATMSDWGATRSTAPSGREGLDLAMPGPSGPWGDRLVAAVRSGEVPPSAIDDKVRRILRLAARVGALEGVPGAAQAPAITDAELAAELRAAAAAGFVLLRNTGVLPVDATAVRRVAVLGPNASAARTLGGGSATVYPPYTVSPLEGLTAGLGDGVEVGFARGVTAHTRIPTATTQHTFMPDSSGSAGSADGSGGADGADVGVLVVLLAQDGTELASERRTGGAYNWMGGYGQGVDSASVKRIQVRTQVRADEPGVYAIGGSGVGRFRLELDGTQVFDETLVLRPGADVVEALMTPPQRTAEVTLAAGQTVDVLLTHDTGALSSGMEHLELPAVFQFNIQPPVLADDDAIAEAVALARDADVAVVVVGTNEEVESEGYDRTSLALPGRQDELVAAVAAVNARTVVLVNSGAPVLMPWADDVAAVMLTWFPGQEMGNAIADVITGRVEPGGRLPTTWPLVEAGLPAGVPAGGQLAYDEGLFIGYRAYDRDQRPSRYPFGHGLGYTTWAVGSVAVASAVRPGEDLPVTVTVRNTGPRPGRQVVQLYAGRLGEGVERPVRWLAGFATVEADPGEQVTVQITVPARSLEYWDESGGGWSAEPGRFRIEAGTSVADLPVSAQIEVGA